MSELESVKKGGKQKVKIAVHPLFWVFGVYFCLKGELLVFVLITLAALEHECAHAFAGARRGYVLNKIVLMPYGAVVRGDIGGISLKDELFVAAAGPFVSGATALAFVALWWLFPETYAFTDSAAYACASLALVNLIPAHPLDGGRIAFCLFSRFWDRKRAWVVCKTLSLLFCLFLLGGFIYTVAVSAVNVTLLFFALFLGVGCFQGEKYGYERMKFDLSEDLRRGVEERRVAVSENTALQKLIPMLARDKYLILDVFSPSGECVATLRQEEICRLLETEDLQKKLSEIAEIMDKITG